MSKVRSIVSAVGSTVTICALALMAPVVYDSHWNGVVVPGVLLITCVIGIVGLISALVTFCSLQTLIDQLSAALTAERTKNDFEGEVQSFMVLSNDGKCILNMDADVIAEAQRRLAAIKGAA